MLQQQSAAGSLPQWHFVVASASRMSGTAPDDLSTGSKRLKRTVGFDLPGATYATVVLWAFGE